MSYTLIIYYNILQYTIVHYKQSTATLKECRTPLALKAETPSTNVGA